MFIALLLACVVGICLPQTAPPTKCCSDREFEATLGEVGGTMYHTQGHYVQNFLEGFNKLSYDSYNEMMAIQSIITYNKQTFRSRIIMDYPNKRQYLIMLPNNTCVIYDLLGSFRPSCIPDDAVFDGYSHMGYGIHELPLVNWRYKEPGTDHVVKVAMTAQGCIPVMEAMFGHYNGSVITQGQETTSNVLFLINGFTPSISDRSVFNIPSGCVYQGGVLPGFIGRSLRSVRGLYTK